MCGICGKISLADNKTVTRESLKKMTDVLRHRGPDGEGFYISPDKVVGLGHRRLAIIDLATGNQPMANENKTIWLVFNGEIYNFIDIKKGLEGKGHRFTTKSDTETILHAYEEYGEACVEHFNGMFSFAIWDENKQKLYLARDRLGKKPLFYIETPMSFIFASEIKAILENPEVKREIDVQALSIYFSVGYFLAPFSIINNIKKLPAGFTLTFNDGNLNVRQYWDLDSTKKDNKTEKQWIDEFRDLLADSVKIRLMTDVPLGAFLSGGIDSTSIVNLMEASGVDKPKTFSIGFEEPTYSELNYARLAASFLATDHQDLIVKPNIEKVLPKIIFMNDEPLGDTSAIPMYFLSEMTRRKVTVVLSGDGGDENLAGYETYIADRLFSFYQKLPFKQLISKSVLKYWPTSLNKVSFDYKLKQFVKAGKFSPEKAHFFWRVIFSDDEKKKLFKQSFYGQIINKDTYFYFKPYFDKHKTGDFLDRAMYVDIKTWLVDDILVKVDRSTMGNSLEARAPFLDYRLVEFLAKAPVNVKLRMFNKKYLLKKAMKGLIPKEIISRPKAGFNAPIPLWLKKDLKQLLLKNLSERNVGMMGIFNYEYIKNLMNDYFSGKTDNSLKLWLLLNFTIWYKRFINNSD